MKKITIERINEIIYEHTLPCGLKIYIWPFNKANDIYMTLNIRYGSLHTSYEVQGEKYNVPNGMAHFLEHIKFNEKDGKTAHDFFN